MKSNKCREQAVALNCLRTLLFHYKSRHLNRINCIYQFKAHLESHSGMKCIADKSTLNARNRIRHNDSREGMTVLCFRQNRPQKHTDWLSLSWHTTWSVHIRSSITIEPCKTIINVSIAFYLPSVQMCTAHCTVEQRMWTTRMHARTHSAALSLLCACVRGGGKWRTIISMRMEKQSWLNKIKCLPHLFKMKWGERWWAINHVASSKRKYIKCRKKMFSIFLSAKSIPCLACNPFPSFAHYNFDPIHFRRQWRYLARVRAQFEIISLPSFTRHCLTVDSVANWLPQQQSGAGGAGVRAVCSSHFSAIVKINVCVLLPLNRNFI